MGVKREFLGEANNGAPVYGYHITNTNGMEVVVMNFGATIKNIFVPTKDGEKIDVALGYDDLSQYFTNDVFFGSTVGPSANRVKDAKFTIDGQEYILAINDGANNLHSDANEGLHKRVWDTVEEENSVTFSIKMEDGDIGFPGNKEFSLTYTLGDDNALSLHYHATSDANTLINPTNHVYFNLSGHKAQLIGDHVMQMNASKYTPVVKGAIPTGEIADVAGTPLDFTQAKPIGKDIDADFEQLELVGGYDHNFCIDNADGTRRSFCDVLSPVTGITLHCSTTLPGFQFYSGNFINDVPGKENVVYKKRSGFCLETQFYPNSINEPEFPDSVFGPNREYDSITVYQFS